MLSLNEIPTVSFFAQRALSATMPLADEAQRLQWLKQLQAEPFTRERMLAALDGKETSETLLPALRQLRREVMLTLLSRQATGFADYFEVVKTMTDLAELAVSRVVKVFSLELAARYGIPLSLIHI